MSVAQEIEANGWAPVEFGMDQASREEFARLGRDVILLSVEDAELAEGLSFTLDPELNVGGSNATFFGVSGARNSADDKLWIHAGYQTRGNLDRCAPKFKDVEEVKSYLDALEDVLLYLQVSFRDALESAGISRDAVDRVFLPNDNPFSRILHVRTVRYLNLDHAEPGAEVIAGHGDLGFASMQFYQTHKGYLYGAKVEPGWISREQSEDRRGYFRGLYDKMLPIEYDLGRLAAFFFGFSTVSTNHERLDTRVQTGFPGLYHAGFLPKTEELNVEGGWMLPNERVAVVAFLHPRFTILRRPELYKLPTVETCRPLLETIKK